MTTAAASEPDRQRGDRASDPAQRASRRLQRPWFIAS
jgi:hypothetical protein